MKKISRQDQPINYIFITIILYSLIIVLFMPPKSAFTSEHIPDEHTLILLHFNGNLNGADGEMPAHDTGVAFEEGIFGTGAYFPVGNQLFYDSLNNIDSTEGTIEFWIKPRWNGDDGIDHYLWINRLKRSLIICAQLQLKPLN